MAGDTQDFGLPSTGSARMSQLLVVAEPSPWMSAGDESTASRLLPRRSVVTAILLLLAMMLAIGDGKADEKTAISPDALVRNFPPAQKIPGAHAVLRYPCEGAQHCLIHIRNFHGSPDMSLKTANVVDEVQDDIVAILRTLMKMPETRLDQAYVEGMIRYEGMVFGALADAASTSLISPETAVATASWQTGLKLVPAENADVYSRALASIHANTAVDGPIRRENVLSDRENALLDIIAERGDPVAMTVYGGFHDWSDNIRVWNRRNPDHKFALIEITPTSYHWFVCVGKRPPNGKSSPPRALQAYEPRLTPNNL